VVSGTAAIQKFWQGALDSGIAGAKLTAVEVEDHGATAHEVGQYELSDKAGKVLDRGKYVVIWKRDGKQWKLHRDIWTTSQPPDKP
jgi:ketosteroid isomerase-like protein